MHGRNGAAGVAHAGKLVVHGDKLLINGITIDHARILVGGCRAGILAEVETIAQRIQPEAVLTAERRVQAEQRAGGILAFKFLEGEFLRDGWSEKCFTAQCVVELAQAGGDLVGFSGTGSTFRILCALAAGEQQEGHKEKNKAQATGACEVVFSHGWSLERPQVRSIL